jgi:tRNA nucleotidyltransferase/poly(A) polymerase
LKAIATPRYFVEPFARVKSLPKGALGDIKGRGLPIQLESWVNSLPNDLLKIVSIFAENNAGIWVVGGSIRQGLSGVTPNDYDLATDMKPNQVLKCFPKSIETGVEYGTVTVRLKAGGDMFEVTTLRCDQEYLDGRRPESVDFGTSLTVDLERRDLTINAMAIDLARQELYDPYNGLDDLQSGVLRAVGEATLRLEEDGLRVMRVYRFMDQGDGGLWHPDEMLSAALIECREMLVNVSLERVWHELRRILSGFHAADVLARMDLDGVLKIIFNGHTFDLNGQSSLQIISENSVIESRLAMMFRGDNPANLLKHLTMPKSVINRVSELRRSIGNLPNENDVTQLRVYRAVLGAGLDAQLACERALDTKDAKNIQAALNQLPENDAKDVALADGHWIVDKTGIKPGIRLGRLKDYLHRLQVENNVSSLDELHSMLNDIDWEESDPSDWPQLRWP